MKDWIKPIGQLPKFDLFKDPFNRGYYDPFADETAQLRQRKSIIESDRRADINRLDWQLKQGKINAEEHALKVCEVMSLYDGRVAPIDAKLFTKNIK